MTDYLEQCKCKYCEHYWNGWCIAWNHSANPEDIVDNC